MSLSPSSWGGELGWGSVPPTCLVVTVSPEVEWGGSQGVPLKGGNDQPSSAERERNSPEGGQGGRKPDQATVCLEGMRVSEF